MTKETKAGAATEKVATPVTIEEAMELIAKHEATIAEQNEVIAELSSNNLALEAKVEQFKTGVVVLPEVTVKGKKYQVNNGTIHNQVKYTRDELANDVKACESILAITGQTTITLIDEEAE